VLEILQVPALNDNYSYLLHDRGTGNTAVIDPGEAKPILDAAKDKGWTITDVWLTHHHADHIGGTGEICAAYDCRVVAAAADAYRIPNIDVEVHEGDLISVGESVAKVFETPGHTSGHIAYWFEDASAIFTGDTLFALGCGRLFEGTPDQMWSSLLKIRALPDETTVYCAHEYTLANAQFSVGIDPQNIALKERAAEISALRKDGKPTVPSSLSIEKATNPFLRADNPELAAEIGLEGSPANLVFAEIRKRKDNA